MDNPKQYNKEAEEAVVGAILIDPGLYSELGLKASDFYIERHRFIWLAMSKLVSKNLAIDLLTLSNQLEADGTLNEIGGPARLATYLTSVHTVLYAQDHARIVKECAKQRQTIRILSDITKLTYDENADTNRLQSVYDKLGRRSLWYRT